MDVKEIERECEVVDSIVAKNVDQKDILGLIAKGVWQLALQMAKAIDLDKQ